MTTAEVTRLTVWERKFNRWVIDQDSTRDADGFVTLLSSDPGNGEPAANTPWTRELPLCDRIQITEIKFQPEDGVLMIVIHGRNANDYWRPTPHSRLETYWPKSCSSTCTIDGLPPEGRRFLKKLVNKHRP